MFTKSIALKCLLTSACISASASTACAETLPIKWMPQSGMQGAVTGAGAEIVTSQAGIAVEFDTAGLTPGHVGTLWIVALQNPQECDPRPCIPKDGIGRWEAVNNAVTHGAGGVVASDGTLKLSSFLPSGAVDENWFPTAITQPTTAEVHVILNDHGPLIPGMEADMLTSYRGGCTDDSLPPIFPDTAKLDGTPGPNNCRLIQLSILVQDKPTTN